MTNEKVAVLSKRAADINTTGSIPAVFEKAFQDAPIDQLDPTQKPTISRNRFLKILSSNPAQYHPIFSAYDQAPEMPIDHIANAAVSLGDQVEELDFDAAIKEGWDEKMETLQNRGEGTILMRRPGVIVTVSQIGAPQPLTNQELVSQVQKPAFEPNPQSSNYIEGVGVYPLPNNTPITQPEALPQAASTPSNVTNLRFIRPLTDEELKNAA